MSLGRTQGRQRDRSTHDKRSEHADWPTEAHANVLSHCESLWADTTHHRAKPGEEEEGRYRGKRVGSQSKDAGVGNDGELRIAKEET